MRIFLLILFVTVSLTAGAQNGVRRIDGAKLYVKIIGKGEPIIIVHGGPGLNHSYFLPHLELLAKHYKLVFYDQRASGESATPSADSISLKFFASDIEALRNFLGVPKITVMAHSWGVLPAVAYAMHYPDHVAKMIFVNPVPLSHAYDAEMRSNLAAVATSSDTTDMAIIRGSRAFKSGNPDAYRQLLQLSFRHSFYNPASLNKLQINLPINYASQGRALYEGLGKDLAEYDFYDSLKRFSFPVLILTGSRDLTPATSVAQMQSNLKNGRVETFSKSGHFVFIEEPKKFVSIVKAFINGEK